MQKIYTKITWDIATGALDSEEFFWYDGKIALLCGATQAQTANQQAEANFYTQATQQASQVFGASSQVFQQLQSTFAPTVAAGPSQEGFSAAELANQRSQAITNNGVATRNAEQAAGESIAAQGGGNNPALQSGTNAGVKANIDIEGADNTANALSQITANDYATGRANYDTAVSGLEGSSAVFNPSTSATGAATGAGTAAGDEANQIAASANSPWQAALGALGGVAGSFASGGLGKLIGSGSGSNPNSASAFAALGGSQYSNPE